jgi:2-methylisocitrate lyase-like PEP mutase family enzyme
MPPDMAALGQIVQATTAPVNALVAGHFTKNTLSDFANIGVGRISLGSSLARITHRAMHDAATAMLGDGDFSNLGESISSDVIDALLRK